MNLYESIKSNLTNFNLDINPVSYNDIWLSFTGDGVEGSAKVFIEGSDFGIPRFRKISKLSYSTKDDKCNYDRGWDVKPKNKELFSKICKALEAYRDAHPYDVNESELVEMDTWVDPRSKVSGWKVKILDVTPDANGNAVAKVELFDPDGNSKGEDTTFINRKKVKIGETYDAYIDGIMAMPRVKGVSDFTFDEIRNGDKSIYEAEDNSTKIIQDVIKSKNLPNGTKVSSITDDTFNSIVKDVQSKIPNSDEKEVRNKVAGTLYGMFEESEIWTNTPEDEEDYHFVEDDLDVIVSSDIEKQCFRDYLVLFGVAANWRGSYAACKVINVDDFKSIMFPDYDSHIRLCTDNNGNVYYLESTHDTPTGGTEIYLYSFKNEDAYFKAENKLKELLEDEDFSMMDFESYADYKTLEILINDGILTNVKISHSINESDSGLKATILDFQSTGGGTLSYVGEVGNYNFIGDIDGSLEFLDKKWGIDSWDKYQAIEDEAYSEYTSDIPLKHYKYGKDIGGTYDFEQKYAEFIPEYLPLVADALESYANTLKNENYKDYILEEVNRMRNTSINESDEKKVKVSLYGDVKEYPTIEDAIKDMKTAMSMCDPNSSEFKRYLDIYSQLKEGKTNCTDNFNEAEVAEDATEKYWDATTIQQDQFLRLMKFNFTEPHGCQYIITNDANEIERFSANSDEEALEQYNLFKEGLDSGLIELIPQDLNVKPIVPRD